MVITIFKIGFYVFLVGCFYLALGRNTGNTAHTQMTTDYTENCTIYTISPPNYFGFYKFEKFLTD